MKKNAIAKKNFILTLLFVTFSTNSVFSQLPNSIYSLLESSPLFSVTTEEYISESTSDHKWEVARHVNGFWKILALDRVNYIGGNTFTVQQMGVVREGTSLGELVKTGQLGYLDPSTGSNDSHYKEGKVFIACEQRILLPGFPLLSGNYTNSHIYRLY